MPGRRKVIEYLCHLERCYNLPMNLPEQNLQELLELARENNEMLKGVHRRARWSMFFWILRWAIVVGILFGAYYYVEPYVDKAVETYQKTTNTIKDLQHSADKVTNNKALQLILGENGTTSTSSVEVMDKSVWDSVLRVLGI